MGRRLRQVGRAAAGGAAGGRVALVLAVAGVLAGGCGGPTGMVPAPRPGTAIPAVTAPATAVPGTTAPVPGATAPGATAPGVTAPGVSATGTARAARYLATVSAIQAAMRRRMIGASWHPGCPLGIGQLRLLTLSYWGFDHAAHHGQLIVNHAAVTPLARAFGLLFAARYPIRQMRVVDVFGGSDERSMRADNTSAFNCRLIRGTTSWSEHAYGLAVDINPFENPEILGTTIDPPTAAAWASRSRRSPALIRHGDAVWRAFISVGWKWGGDWTSPKDYQHFSANGS